MKATYKKLRARDSGFSVIEATVAISILTLVGLAVYAFQKNVFSLNRILSQSIVAQEEVRHALKIMSAEIRAASPSSVGAYAIAQTTASSFIFYSNIDDDPFKERVRYFLDGATLKKGVTKPAGDPLTYSPSNEVVRDVVRDVANGTTALFSYYDTDYDGTSLPLTEPIDISVVRLVRIVIIVDRDVSLPPGPMTLTTQISMRNLKDNL